MLQLPVNTCCCPGIQSKNDGLFDASVLSFWQIHAHLEAIRERQGGVLEAVLRVAQEGQQILVTFNSRDGIVSKNDGAVSQLGQRACASDPSNTIKRRSGTQCAMYR